MDQKLRRQVCIIILIEAALCLTACELEMKACKSNFRLDDSLNISEGSEPLGGEEVTKPLYIRRREGRKQHQ